MLDQIQPHIRKIEKFLQETQEDVKSLGELMNEQLNTSKSKIITQLRNCANPQILSPFCSKALAS